MERNEKMTSRPIMQLLRASTAKKDNCGMSWAGFWKSLLQTVTSRNGRAHYLAGSEAPRSWAAACHQISFAGIHYTCQNIHHVLDSINHRICVWGLFYIFTVQDVKDVTFPLCISSGSIHLVSFQYIHIPTRTRP